MPAHPAGGFTLLEIIIAMLALAVMGLVSTQYIRSLIEMNQLNVGQTALVERARIGMALLTRELRDADEANNPVRCGASQVNCVIGTGYDQVTFDKTLENPVDPLRRDTNATDIVYAHNAGANTLERTSGGITTTVVDNLTGFTITEVTSNLYQIEMTLAGSSGENFSLKSAVRVRNPVPPLNLALVVGSPFALDANQDTPLKNHIETTLGHTVTLQDDDIQTWSPTTFDGVIISASGTDSNQAWLCNQGVGILTMDGNTNNELGLGSGGSGSGGNDNDINILNNTHAITKSFSLGVLTVTTATGNAGYMLSTVPDLLAHYASNTSRYKLIAVETGTTLEAACPAAPGTTTAPARRVFFGQEYFANLNPDGKTLFNRSLSWVTQ